jgi:Uma2 family endonuclease
MTLEEFLKLPEEKPYLEYIDGRIEAKVSPQRTHGWIQYMLISCLNDFARPKRVGLAFPEQRCTYAGRSIVADGIFLLAKHIRRNKKGRMVDDSFVVPDIHIEILSPKQSRRVCHQKLAHSTAHGCSLGWLIDPYKMTVTVYRPGRPRQRLGEADSLEGDPVLPGFRLPVSEVFGWPEADA